MAVIDVRISMVNGQLVASPDSVSLSKARGETINWHNDTTETIQLDFTNGSPFPPSRNPYTIAAGKPENSGGIQVNENTNWSYTMSAASGVMADPQVIIQR